MSRRSMLFLGFPMAAATRLHRQLPLGSSRSAKWPGCPTPPSPVAWPRVAPSSPNCDESPRWDAESLQAALASEARREVRLTLTENRSVLLSFRRRGSHVLLRLHRMFLHAPLAVVRGGGPRPAPQQPRAPTARCAAS